MSHVKFLESAGARVVPVDYTDGLDIMKKQLRNLNGIYIPGDSPSLIEKTNIEYTHKVRDILLWAQNHNEEDDLHFPVMGVGYGFLSMIRSQTKNTQNFQEIEAKGRLQINLAHDPVHTYIFDEYSKEQLEESLDKIKFFNDVEMGMTMSDFVLKEKTMS